MRREGAGGGGRGAGGHASANRPPQSRIRLGDRRLGALRLLVRPRVLVEALHEVIQCCLYDGDLGLGARDSKEYERTVLNAPALAFD